MKDEIRPKENSRCTRLKSPVNGERNSLRIMIVAIVISLAAICIGPAMGQTPVVFSSSGVWTEVQCVDQGNPVTCSNVNYPVPNEIRWGTSAEGGQSGLRFDGQSVNSQIGQEFCLGALTHYNIPIYAPSASSATLDIKLTFTNPQLAPVTFTYNMAIDETPNQGTCDSCAYSPCSTPCPDKISWPNAIPPQTFVIGGDTYTLQIVGIKDVCPSGALKTNFITQEDMTNVGYLVGRIVRVGVPVANDDTATTDEDIPVTASAAGNDIPSSDGGNVWSLIGEDGDAAHGTVTITAEGTYTYTPDAGWSGVDTFNYRICDIDGDCDPAIVAVTVTPVNDAPHAVDDAYSTLEDTPVTVPAPGVLVNDEDIDGDALTVTDYTQPTNGAVTVNADGSLTYTPNENYCGQDGFSYTITDEESLTDTADVVIDVTCINDCPVAVDDEYEATEDTPLNVPVDTGVLENDEDIDSATLTVASFDATSVNGGTVALSTDGSFVYTPAADFCGEDTFTYKVTDGICAPESQDTGTVTIYVECVEDNICPEATDDEYEATEDTPLNVPVDTGVLENDEDIDSATLTVASFDATSVNGGTVALSTDGSFVYTPAADFCGEDTFTYKVTDGICAPESQDIGTVTIYVECVEDNVCPVAWDDGYGAIYGKLLVVSAADGILLNDEDDDGDELTAELVTGPSHGTLTLRPDGSFTYKPVTGFTGTDTFTYRAFDGECYSDPAMVTILVAKCPWFLKNELYSAKCGTAKEVPASQGILANDPGATGVVNPEGIAIDPKYGTIVVEEDGSFVYNPQQTILSGTYVQFKYNATNGVCEAKYQGIAKIQVSCPCP